MKTTKHDTARPPRLTPRLLRGIWAGVTLSWNEDYSFDEASYRENLRRLCAAKVHGIYTTGSTGEFYALDFAEFQRMVDIVVATVRPKGIPVQVGCCADDTRDVLQQVEHAARAGVTASMLAVLNAPSGFQRT